jgi:hypothetical protein
MPDLKPFTQYRCPVGGGSLGHSSIWTGAYKPPHNTHDGTCVCGAEMVEDSEDGTRYRLEWESIDSHQAADIELMFGKGIWPKMPEGQWDALSWHPVSKEGTELGLRDQYQTLKKWAESHKQPIRNVRLLKAAIAWSEVADA